MPLPNTNQVNNELNLAETRGETFGIFFVRFIAILLALNRYMQPIFLGTFFIKVIGIDNIYLQITVSAFFFFTKLLRDFYKHGYSLQKNKFVLFYHYWFTKLIYFLTIEYAFFLVFYLKELFCLFIELFIDNMIRSHFCYLILKYFLCLFLSLWTIFNSVNYFYFKNKDLHDLKYNLRLSLSIQSLITISTIGIHSPLVSLLVCGVLSTFIEYIHEQKVAETTYQRELANVFRIVILIFLAQKIQYRYLECSISDYLSLFQTVFSFICMKIQDGVLAIN